MLFKNQKEIIENGRNGILKKLRGDALEILASALDSVDPYKIVKTIVQGKKILFDEWKIDTTNFENVYLVGFGKASVRMAQAICNIIEIKKGIVITNNANSVVENEKIQTITGGHPIPNKMSIKGTEKIIQIVENCKESDLLIVVISGGGSALLCKPRTDLKDMQKTTNLLLKSGADINEINTVRKHLSFVKGGQLIKNVKCKVVSLIISDIVGDPLEFIASGPTYPDSTTYKDAKNILNKYDLSDEIPKSVMEILEKGTRRNISETLKINNPIFEKVSNFVIANNEIACNAAKIKAKNLGYDSMILTTLMTGKAKDTGVYLASKAKEFTKPGKKNYAFISGGETTVTITGNGQGGRNQEMILAGIDRLHGSNLVFASFATDGIDGNSKSAGAIADCFTKEKAIDRHLNSDTFLKNNDSYDFFQKLDDLLITGPTGTNVMDIQIILKAE